MLGWAELYPRKWYAVIDHFTSISDWLTQEFCLTKIGAATAVGHFVKVPVLIRSLADHLNHCGDISDTLFHPDMIVYLDGTLSSRGPDDPDLLVTKYLLPWWTRAKEPMMTEVLSAENIQRALTFHEERVDEVITDVLDADELAEFEKRCSPEPNQGPLPSSIPHGNCRMCQTYRTTANDRHESLLKIRQALHASQIASEAEADIARRRASGFNNLYEAAMNKMPAAAQDDIGDADVDSDRGLQDRPADKWVWGVDLDDEDIWNMVRGADGENNKDSGFSHSGYDMTLATGELPGEDSPLNSARHSEIDESGDRRFEELSADIREVRALRQSEHPGSRSGWPLASKEPHRPSARLLAKRVMQEEVNIGASSSVTFSVEKDPFKAFLGPQLKNKDPQPNQITGAVHADAMHVPFLPAIMASPVQSEDDDDKMDTSDSEALRELIGTVYISDDESRASVESFDMHCSPSANMHPADLYVSFGNVDITPSPSPTHESMELSVSIGSLGLNESPTAPEELNVPIRSLGIDRLASQPLDVDAGMPKEGRRTRRYTEDSFSTFQSSWID